MSKKRKKIFSLIVTVLFLGLGIIKKEEVVPWVDSFFPTDTAQTREQSTSKDIPISSNENHSERPLTYDSQQYDQLAGTDFQSGGNAVLQVNNGRSTLDITQWKQNCVIYGELDSLNRTSFVTAFLDKKNLGRSVGRERQQWHPTGWHQKIVDGEAILNRGHLLAYTSSFNFDSDGNFKQGTNGSQDNPKNLATQTAFSNQKVQSHYEHLVRDAQKIEGNKIIYQIVTVFRGNELMPRGYWLQAIDSKGTLNFNVYEYNVQPKVIFTYEDGTSQIDRSMKVNWNWN